MYVFVEFLNEFLHVVGKRSTDVLVDVVFIIKQSTKAVPILCL